MNIDANISSTGWRGVLNDWVTV